MMAMIKKLVNSELTIFLTVQDYFDASNSLSSGIKNNVDSMNGEQCVTL